MLSRTSFFNATLFRKNLERSWPLWGGVSLMGSLVPLYLMLGMVRYAPSHDGLLGDFTQMFYIGVTELLPVMTFGYAALCGLIVWSYLQGSRSVGMLHALPIDRTGLFVTSTLSALAMLLIPYVVVGGLLILIAAGWDALDVGAVMLTILAVILENLLFFGMVTLCAMVSGSVIGTAVFYLILNFAAPVMDMLVRELAQDFIFGLGSEITGISTALSPLLMLYDAVNYECRYDEAGNYLGCTLENYGVIVLYSLAGLALLALSYVFYRFRRSESAGDLVAVRWLKPVFRFGVAAVSALTVGRALYLLFWESFYQTGEYADIVPMCVCMILAALLGYYIATMFLQKSLRVFKGSLKNAAVVAVSCAVLAAVVATDVLGIEGRVPEADEVVSVELSYYNYIHCDAATMPTLTEDILAFHRAVVADKDYVVGFNRNDYHSDEPVSWSTVRLEYELKDGSTLERRYELPLTETRSYQAGSYEALLLDVLSNPEALMAEVTLPEDAAVYSVFLEYYAEDSYEWYNANTATSQQAQAIYEAVLRDARNGAFMLESYRIYRNELYQDEIDRSSWLNIEYYVPDQVGGSRTYRSLNVQLNPAMTHTLRALEAAGMDMNDAHQE